MCAVKRNDPKPETSTKKKPSPKPTTTTTKNLHALYALALVALALIAYVPSFNAGFVWDDRPYILENPHLKSPTGLWDIWTVWQTPGKKESGYWPLTYSTFWLEYQIFGFKTFWYHLDNVLLHGLNAVLVWALLLALGVPGAWLGAALFALHPIRVESVAWVVERKDLLSGLFYLLAFLSWLRFDRLRVRRFYVFALALFTCAMLSKSMTVSFPVALLLVLWWRKESLTKQHVQSLIPFFAIGGILTLVGMIISRDPARTSQETLGLLERVLVSGRAFWFYAYKFFWPLDYAAIYTKWNIDTFAPLQYFFPASALAVFWLLFRFREKIGKGPLVAVLYFAITLLPVLGFFYFPLFDYTYAANRYMYLPSIGLGALVAAAAASWAASLRVEKRPVVHAAIASVLLILGLLTWHNSRVYTNEETLFTDCLEYDPNCTDALLNIGSALARRNEVEKAQEYFNRVLEILPENVEALSDLGCFHAVQGRPEKAVEMFTRALAADPNKPRTEANLARAYADMGVEDKALEHFKKAIALEPNDASLYAKCGRFLFQTRRFDDAVENLAKAAELDPADSQAPFNLGQVYSSKDNAGKAAEWFSKAVSMSPGNIEMVNNLASALAKQGKFDEALTRYRESINVNPNHPIAHFEMAKLLETHGRTDEAAKEYREVLRIDPKSAETQARLDALPH